MQYYCSNKQRILNVKKAKLFLKEYMKFRKLSKKEIEILPDIITAVCIEDFAYAYWLLINDPLRAKFYRLKKYSRAAQWYYKNRNNLIKELRN
jgi:Ser/Thr protein kinase RdoA (MazF antagonist)